MNRGSRTFLTLACSLALGGCGGTTFSIGNTGDGDAGEAGAGANASGGTTGSSGGADTTGSSSGSNVGSGSGSTTGSSSGNSSGSFSFGDGGSSTTGPACTQQQIVCPAGTVGYVCSGNVYPDTAQPDLSCSAGITDGFNEDYCCFPWIPGNGACKPYYGFPCDGGSFPYQCSSGTPSSSDSKLSCGTPFPDSNGTQDFCCTYQ